MERERYFHTIEEEERRMVAAAEAAGLAALVPSCPGWTVSDLLGHVGRLNLRWARMLEERRAEPPDRAAETPAPPEVRRPEWVIDTLGRFLRALRSTPSDTPVWTFGPPPTAAFYARRFASETVVHRVDAELALGAPSPLDGDLAADGIDELFDVFASRVPAAARETTTLHVHCTDRDGEWLLTLGPEGLAVAREHAKGDAALRGPAGALFLVLWNRAGIDQPGVELFGDADALARVREALAV